MKTLKNIDYTLPLLLFIFLVAAVTSLPFDSRVDMSSDEKLTVNVESVSVQDGDLFLGSRLVEVDPEIDVKALVDQKEEIVLRVMDNRISVIYGDN